MMVHDVVVLLMNQSRMSECPNIGVLDRPMGSRLRKFGLVTSARLIQQETPRCTTFSDLRYRILGLSSFTAIAEGDLRRGGMEGGGVARLPYDQEEVTGLIIKL